jgi:hypothetical protein
MSSKRVDYGQRRVKISPEAIEAWLVYGNAVRTDLPEDARLCSLWHSDLGECYYLLFESQAWDEQVEAEEIPLITPDVERKE